MVLTVGVLALQGGFAEHLASLRKAAAHITEEIRLIEVRTPAQLAECDALVIPGGESTTLSLVAAQSGLLEPLRHFVKVQKKPTWGTCAGLIMLSEAATATKKGGQELIGGLNVRVHRNHFGRQRESFMTDLDLAFLRKPACSRLRFPAVFIRAPVVDKVLAEAVEDKSAQNTGVVSTHVHTDNYGHPKSQIAPVEVLAVLSGRHASNTAAQVGDSALVPDKGDGDIIALRQGNVFGTSFHPELTDDIRIHSWWLEQVVQARKDRRHPRD